MECRSLAPGARREIARAARASGLVTRVALLVPLLAGLLGLLNDFRMMRRPDPAPSETAETALA